PASASEKDCRSRAENDKDHAKGELLSHVNPIWRQRSLVSFPIHSFYGNSEPKLSKSSNFFRKRPREGHRGVDLIFTILRYGRLWYGSRTQSRTLSGTPNSTAVHMMLSLAYSTWWATWSMRTSRRAISKNGEFTF